MKRRTVLLTAAAVPAVALADACGAPDKSGGSGGKTGGPVPAKPGRAVTLNVLDVAGDLQLTQGMIAQFVSRPKDQIAKVTYSKATAPELVGKIKAPQGAGRVDIGPVLTGVDGLAGGIDQNLWLPLLPTYQNRVAGMSRYLPGAAAMQKLAGDFGVTVTYYPSGVPSSRSTRWPSCTPR